jgi:hypothetical protein
MFDLGIKNGQGGMYLNLTETQFAALKTPIE